MPACVETIFPHYSSFRLAQSLHCHGKLPGSSRWSGRPSIGRLTEQNSDPTMGPRLIRTPITGGGICRRNDKRRHPIGQAWIVSMAQREKRKRNQPYYQTNQQLLVSASRQLSLNSQLTRRVSFFLPLSQPPILTRVIANEFTCRRKFCRILSDLFPFGRKRRPPSLS